MTRETKSNSILRRQSQMRMGRNGKDMMAIQGNSFTETRMKSTFWVLASIVISAEDCLSKLLEGFRISYATFIALPISVLFTSGPRITRFTFIPRDMSFGERFPCCKNELHNIWSRSWVKIRDMSFLVSHSFKTGMVAFFESLIPSRFVSETNTDMENSGMMSPNKFGIMFSRLIPVRTLFDFLSTTAFTKHTDMIYRQTRVVKQNLINSVELLIRKIRTIPSQTRQECLGGVETTTYGQELTMKSHENQSRRVRYSPSHIVICGSLG